MKLRAPLLAAALGLAFSTAQAANDTATLAVTASVAAVCKLSLSANAAFGALDPTLTTDPAPKAIVATYRCTKGTPVTNFTVAGGTSGSYTGAMASAVVANTDTIPFTITWTNPTAFTGAGMGSTATAKTVNLSVAVTNAGYVNVTPDSYSANVSVAVNY